MGTLFNIAKGKQNNILNQNPQEGYVWFATDSQKIFYSNGEEFIPMGGNSSIHYGTLDTSEANEGQTNFEFTYDDIESTSPGATTVQENDLILNSDGCFYRVSSLDIDEDETIIYALRLTIAGTGSGSSSGGESGGTTSGTAKVEYVSPTAIDKDNIAVLKGKECLLSFNVISTDSAGDNTTGGTVTWKVGGVVVATGIPIIPGINTFDISPYLKSGSQSIQGIFSIDVGTDNFTTIRKGWTVNQVTIDLNWDYDFSNIITDSSFPLSWSVTGANLSKTTIFTFDDIYTFETTSSVNSIQTQIFNNREAYGLNHGVHKISLQAKAIVGGVEFYTDKITKNILFKDADNNASMVAFGLQNQIMTQYNTLVIPVVAYSSSSDNTSTIQLSDGNTIVDTWENVSNGTVKNWVFTPTTIGEHKLSVYNNGAEASISIYVEKLNINNEEVQGYKFNLKANEIISNNALQTWSRNGTSLTFSNNFDWVNGGIKQENDENGNPRPYICVKAGTSMTINYKLFENFDSSKGKSFKVIFKVTNCCEYDADAIQCAVVDASGREVGLKIKANEAYLSGDQNIVTSPYCEDNYIELEYDIGAFSSHPFITAWMDGVPSSATILKSGERFTQNPASYIQVGSEDCDVYLYLFKVYEFHLTNNQHLENFIADAPNAQEMLSRFTRNDILDANGEISYDKLAVANPDCWVHLYDIDHMSIDKDEDPVKNCSYRLYRGTDTPDIQAKDVTIKVQGTSSASYGISAFNIDSDFKSGFIDRDGNVSSTFAMSDNSLPQSYFNTKVNVASCEQANNALNVEWYNKFQPYKSRYKLKEPKARDTMEFYPGVMFLLDRNTTTTANSVKDNVFKDTVGYTQNPYYKMYSICNFGNSKKNYSVFHDVENPYECCIEVADNQSDFQKMIKSDFDDSIWAKGEVFDFRYPKYNAENSTVISSIAAWHELVEWMAASNPKAATNEELDEPVTFERYTFKSSIPYWDNSGSYSTVLGGLTVSDFAGTYTHDTYEYRMAKMLKECENHLIMDSFVFHYLFIERHSMVDNVAKNTFWSTEDGVHWNLTKDYDNDTADGINNSGELKLTYGYEGSDKIGDTYVFNAHESVWFNFIGGLKEACRKMYSKLKADGAWEAKSYLKAFNEWQDKIPERCWIEDYDRKYFRPYRVYNNTNFIKMLAGGKKTHQRCQYETYQEIYIDSKYHNQPSSSQVIQFRAQAENLTAGTRIPVKMYTDCYIQTSWGQNWFTQRVKRGESVDIIVPEGITDLNDATVYWHYPQCYSSIGDVSILHPSRIDLALASKLQSFQIGSDEDIDVNTGLTEIAFKGNSLMRKLVIRNCQGTKTNLNLEDLVSLQELDIRGSSFTGVVLPENAPLRKVYLNSIGSINAANLYNLEEFTLENYDSLHSLYIDNIDNTNEVNSKTLVDSAKKLGYYSLRNVKWKIDSESEFISSGDEATELIKTLEFLLEKDGDNYKRNPVILIQGNLNNATPAAALTGSLEITETGYSGDNALDIYNYYTEEERYPNLELTFDAENCKLYTVSVLNGNGGVYWKKKSKINTNLNESFYSYGPNGAFEITAIEKARTRSTVYTFNNTWTIKSASGEVLGIIENQMPYLDNLTEDIVIVPNFDAKVRTYTVIFDLGDNGNQILENIPYGTKVTSIIPDTLPYKDDSLLALEKTYSFEGYSLSQTSSTAIEFKDTDIIIGEAVYYPVFKQISVYDNVHEEYFTIRSENTFVDKADSYFNGAGCYIKPNKTLYGKVTIPIQLNGKDVIGISGFAENKNITHVFFEYNTEEQTHPVRVILQKCFSNCENLKYFDFKKCNMLREIGIESFRGVNNLSLISSFSKNLYLIDHGAFIGAFKNISMLYVNSSVTIIGQYGLCFQDAIQDRALSIQIGIEPEGSQLDIQKSIEYDWNNYNANENGRYGIGQNYGHRLKDVIYYGTKYNSLEDGFIMNAYIHNGQVYNFSVTLEEFLGSKRDSGNAAAETYQIKTS